MAACAENLVPVLMELGGKDAMIVDDDADVVAAADAAVWGAMSNAGQTCIGIERVYATSAVYDRFVAEVTEQVRDAAPGFGRRGDLRPDDDGRRRATSSAGTSRTPSRAGGRVVRGDADPSLFPQRELPAPDGAARRARGRPPPIREETFGPTLTVTKVRDAEEALERANATVLRAGRRRCSPSRRHAAWTSPAGCAAA